MSIDYQERIPNNVHLADDRQLQRALEKWQPHFLEWWKELGPEGWVDPWLEPRVWCNLDQNQGLYFKKSRSEKVTQTR